MKFKTSLLTVILIATNGILNARNCSAEYAIGMAEAAVELFTDMQYCNTRVFLQEYCITEAQIKYESTQNTLYNNFNTCCCSENLVCCNG